MEPYKDSVRGYVEASKRLLKSDDLSEDERRTITDYLDAVEDHLVSHTEQSDDTNPTPDT